MTGRPNATHISRTATIAALCVAAAASLLLAVDTAGATLPGRNGEIALDRSINDGDCQLGRCTSIFYLERVNPRAGRVKSIHVAPPGSTPDQDPAWSPTGRTLAVTRRSSGVFLARVSDWVGHAAFSGGQPTWSPDGRALGFTGSVSKPEVVRPDEIFRSDLRGRARRRLTFGGGQAPDWSSRGQIAFVRYGSDGFSLPANVFVMSARGGRARLVARATADPSWSPDGRWLAVSARLGGRTNVLLMSGSGRHRRLLTRRGGATPVWSPDGKSIAFVRDQHLCLLRLRDGRVRRLAKLGSDPDSLSWQPLR